MSSPQLAIGAEATIGSWGYRWTVMGFKIPGPASRETKAIIAREDSRRFPTDGFVGNGRARPLIRTRVRSSLLQSAGK